MSTVLTNTFKLTKEIESDPRRTQIKAHFEELHRSEITSGSIGYHGRRLYKQFLGYLAIYNDRERINRESPIKIQDLPPDVVNSLTYGHNLIQAVNRLCLTPLSELMPSALRIIDPYWVIESKSPVPNKTTFSGPSYDNLAHCFHSSKAYKVIKNRLTLAPGIKNIQEQELANAVYTIIERIRQAGLKNSPRDIFEIAQTINSRSPKSMLEAIFFSLIHIHSSLQVIDQLLFQAFISDKLLVFDQTNIYDVTHMGSNVLSEILEVCTLDPLFHPGDIVVIHIPDRFQDKKRFCLVEHTNMRFSQDFGNEFQIGARCIDDSCATYKNVIRNIELL